MSLMSFLLIIKSYIIANSSLTNLPRFANIVQKIN